MSEPLNPKHDVLENTGPDQVFEFDVEMIPDQEGIDAVIAWAAAKKAAEDAGESKKSDDPDRPAA